MATEKNAGLRHCLTGFTFQILPVLGNTCEIQSKKNRTHSEKNVLKFNQPHCEALAARVGQSQ